MKFMKQPQGAILSLSLVDVVRAVVAAREDELTAMGAEVTLAPAMPEIFLDRSRLFNLVEILLDNSIRYCRPEAALRITVSARAVGSMVQFRFADNGIGIAPEFRDRVFRVFERLNPHAGDDSTGIGLAVVRRMIEQGNGKVWVEETPGGGATLAMELPSGAEPPPG